MNRCTWCDEATAQLHPWALSPFGHYVWLCAGCLERARAGHNARRLP